ncbi:LapA family protein [Syntrophomonas erecta]
MTAYLLGALAFVLGLVIFVFQNTSPVTVHFISWVSPEVSLAIVVLLAVCAGALITFLVESFRYFKVARQMKDLINKNKKLQDEITGLEKELAGRSNLDN